MLARQPSRTWRTTVDQTVDDAQTTTGEEEESDNPVVDMDAVGKSASKLVPGGTGTLTNFLCDSNADRAKAGARVWGWMYEDVADIQSNPSVGPLPRSRSHTTPNLSGMPDKTFARTTATPPRVESPGGGVQPSAEVSFAPDEELATESKSEPEPETETRVSEGIHQP